MRKRVIVAALLRWPPQPSPRGAEARGRASKESGCRPVNRHLTGRQGPGPGFTAEGRLTGDIQGTVRFTLLSSSPTHPDTPTAINFVGESVFETKSGKINLAVSGPLAPRAADSPTCSRS